MMELLQGREVRRYDSGEIVIEQGSRTGLLFFLIEGTVEICRDGVPVSTASHPGVVFGEMSALLGCDHTATVRAMNPCAFYIVDNPGDFLESSPVICHDLCKLLAHRLDALNKHLVNVKKKSDGNDNLGVLIGSLEAILHHHPARPLPVARARR